MQPRTILLAADIHHADPSLALLRHALSDHASAAAVHAVHVIAKPQGDYVSRLVPAEIIEKVATDLHDRMDALIAQVGGTGRIVPHLLSGGIAEQVVGLAEQLGTDLLVLNAHRPDARFATLGPNANQIVRRAPCSVLVRR